MSKVSSLDVLCNIDGQRLPNEGLGMGNFGSFASLYRSNYFPWANMSSPSYGAAGGAGSDGGAEGEGSGDAAGEESAANNKGSSASLNWPSMNNLVAAADMVKSVDDLASLGISANENLGLNLLGNSSIFLQSYLSASSGNLQEFNIHNAISHLSSNEGSGTDGQGVSGEVGSGVVAGTGRNGEEKAKQQVMDDIGYPLDDGPSVMASALALAASARPNASCSSLIVDATSHIYSGSGQGKVSDLVMHPQPQIGQPLSSIIKTESARNSSNGNGNGKAGGWEEQSMLSVINTEAASYGSDQTDNSREKGRTDSRGEAKEASPKTLNDSFCNRSVSVGTEPLKDGSDDMDLGLDLMDSSGSGSGNGGSSSRKVSGLFFCRNVGVGFNIFFLMVLQTGGQTGAKAEAVLPRNSSVENFWYSLKQLYYFITSV